MTRFTSTGPDYTTHPDGRRSPDGARYESMPPMAMPWGRIVKHALIALPIVAFLLFC